jgi:hypothetical protein
VLIENSQGIKSFDFIKRLQWKTISNFLVFLKGFPLRGQNLKYYFSLCFLQNYASLLAKE